MRIWANSASLGSELARFSRKYFFSLAVLAYAIMSAYQFAGFPYDNVCDVVDNPTFGGSGNYTNVTLSDDTIVDIITVSPEQDAIVKFCRQSWQGFDGFLFPPTANSQPPGLQWMSDSQETLSNVYGYTALAFLVGYIFFFFGSAIKNFLVSWFRGVYQPTGESRFDSIGFSS